MGLLSIERMPKPINNFSSQKGWLPYPHPPPFSPNKTLPCLYVTLCPKTLNLSGRKWEAYKEANYENHYDISLLPQLELKGS